MDRERDRTHRTLNEESVTLSDAKGGTSTAVAADLNGSNGVVHVIDSVLML